MPLGVGDQQLPLVIPLTRNAMFKSVDVSALEGYLTILSELVLISMTSTVAAHPPVKLQPAILVPVSTTDNLSVDVVISAPFCSIWVSAHNAFAGPRWNRRTICRTGKTLLTHSVSGHVVATICE